MCIVSSAQGRSNLPTKNVCATNWRSEASRRQPLRPSRSPRLFRCTRSSRRSLRSLRFFRYGRLFLMPGSISHRTLLQPKSLADALKMLRDEGPLVPMAGCTDLYVSLNFGTLKDTRFLNLWTLDALRKIELH